MAVKFKFNLKEPHNEESLLMLICRWDGQPIKLSTRYYLRIINRIQEQPQN